MFIRSIHIENFRNYRRLDLNVEPSINVFFGENAQGKTNIIEAIYLCACARSHRTSKDRELIFHGEQGYKVQLDMMAHRYRHLIVCREEESVPASSEHKHKNGRKKNDYYEESLSISFLEAAEGPEGLKKARRIAEHDNVPLERISDFMGIFHAVIFAPEDLLLIKEGPSVRRRYMDLLISQVRPCYFHDLLTYSKLLQQRNRTLKLLRQKHAIHTLGALEESELEIWDYPLAQAAARILAERILFAERIKILAKQKHEQISGGKESLFVRYRTITGLLTEEIQNDPMSNLLKIEEILLTRWKATHQDDYEKGNTSVGPHRDDLELSLDGDGLRAFASQGQQRSAALALKLAELVILREETGEMPVLLLDDVFSELDAGRRACLLSNMGGAQVFITCTDRSFIEKELKDRSSPLFGASSGTAADEGKDNVPGTSEKDLRESHPEDNFSTGISFYEVLDGTVSLR
ncbi:MAG: DNA replication/repair protein RecF [Eubacteriales bacterium]